MTDFNQPLEPHEREIFERLSDTVREVQEAVMLSDMAFARLPVYGERGKMLQKFHGVWVDLCKRFIADSDLIANSLSEDIEVDRKIAREVAMLKKAARLGLGGA